MANEKENQPKDKFKAKLRDDGRIELILTKNEAEVHEILPMKEFENIELKLIHIDTTLKKNLAEQEDIVKTNKLNKPLTTEMVKMIEAVKLAKNCIAIDTAKLAIKIINESLANNNLKLEQFTLLKNFINKKQNTETGGKATDDSN